MGATESLKLARNLLLRNTFGEWLHSNAERVGVTPPQRNGIAVALWLR